MKLTEAASETGRTRAARDTVRGSKNRTKPITVNSAKPRKSAFAKAAAQICRRMPQSVIRFFKSAAREIEKMRRDLEQALGVKLTWRDIEDIKRKRRAGEAEAKAFEHRRIAEWHAWERRAFEEEWEERLRRVMQLAGASSPFAPRPTGTAIPERLARLRPKTLAW